MEATVSERLNRLLDRVPHATLQLGGREVPAFRSMGILGFHLALLTAMLTSFRAGVALLDAVGLSAAAGASFFAWGLLRRALTGRETLVLIEYVWVAFGSIALYLWATGGPVVPGLDVLAVSLCPFLALGRIGCLTVGCCHGHPASFGVVYPSSAHLPDRLGGVRLFPVPLVEAVALLAIGAVGFGLAGGRSGSATVWVLAAYATVRFGAESLRGGRRPTIAGVSVARATTVIQLGAALVASEAWLASGGSERRHLAAAVPLSVALIAGLLLTWRRRDPLIAPAHLDEVWSAIVTLARDAPPAPGQPALATSSRGLCVAASWDDAGLHVSMSHPSRTVAGLPPALALEQVARTATAVHVVAPEHRVRRPRSEVRTSAPPVGVRGEIYFGERRGRSGDAAAAV